MKKNIFLIFIFVIFSCSVSAEQNFIYKKTSSSPLDLIFPVSCVPGKDCFITNYPDIDSSDDFFDYKKGKFSLNNNKSVDITLQNLKIMEKGIPVLAAEDGTVVFVRDGINDSLTKEEAQSSCGNAVIVEHNNGWQTLYCHLKKESIHVRKGSFVLKGKKIAEIGLSGDTLAPKLKFLVTNKKSFYDPFSGQELGVAEPKRFNAMWGVQAQNLLKYKPSNILSFGVCEKEPDFEKIIKGELNKHEFEHDVSSIYLWMYALHLQANDILKVNILTPDNQIFLEKNIKIDAGKESEILVFKKVNMKENFKPGAYIGKIEVFKPEQKITQTYNITFKIKEPPENTYIEELKEQLKGLRLKRRKRILRFNMIENN